MSEELSLLLHVAADESQPDARRRDAARLAVAIWDREDGERAEMLQIAAWLGVYDPVPRPLTAWVNARIREHLARYLAA